MRRLLLLLLGAACAGAQTLPPGAALPQWSKPVEPDLPPGSPVVRSGPLQLTHSRNRLGGFVLQVGGQRMAIGQTHPQIGYLAEGQLRWLELASGPSQKITVRSERSAIRVEFACEDTDGAHWTIAQRFTPGATLGTIDVHTELRVDRERAVAFAPLLTILAGVGSFGAHKGQGLFAGLEYLEDEPSSSEADVIGPASKRQVPDTLKITFPLMAIQSGGRYIAMTWQPRPELAALFDSPDRQFGSGGHVMGLLFPGSDGKNREEGNLLPRAAEVLPANQPVILEATLMGGSGRSVVPAIEQYVSMRGLPSLPGPKPELPSYVQLAAGGWLDSKIREGNLYRHAVAGNFHAGRVAEVAVFMDWLAGQTDDTALAERLTETAQAARTEVAPADLNSSAISHVHYPVAALLYGHVAENAARATQAGKQLLGSFEPDGSMRYHQAEGQPDYGRTHFTNEANGLTSTSVQNLLEAAAFSGERELLDAALSRLRAMDKFRYGVPRGAQTWECPLHTPDILGSAHLVRAYTLGYELTGDPALLEEARYWAWTGVPFVYLTDPTAQPVGRYATIAVYGATQWRAPVWLGLPVQWCGLVYADSLYRLVRHDPKGPWKQLADGITISGIQQTWPVEDHDRQGLLPDSFVLRAQKRAAPPINPGTVEACASHLFNRPLYDFWSFRKARLLVHAPGEIQQAREGSGRVSFRFEPAMKRPGFILINGLDREPQVLVDGKSARAQPQYLQKEGQLILEVDGRCEVEIRLGRS